MVNSELRKVATELIADSQNGQNGSDASAYAFRIHGYSGSVYVTEWDPFVSSSGEIHDSELGKDLFEWLGDIALVCGIETSEEEITELGFVMLEELDAMEQLRG